MDGLDDGVDDLEFSNTYHAKVEFNAADAKCTRFLQDRKLIFSAAAELLAHLSDNHGLMVTPDHAVANAIALWDKFDSMSAQYAEGLVEEKK